MCLSSDKTSSSRAVASSGRKTATTAATAAAASAAQAETLVRGSLTANAQSIDGNESNHRQSLAGNDRAGVTSLVATAAAAAPREADTASRQPSTAAAVKTARSTAVTSHAPSMVDSMQHPDTHSVTSHQQQQQQPDTTHNHQRSQSSTQQQQVRTPGRRVLSDVTAKQQRHVANNHHVTSSNHAGHDGRKMAEGLAHDIATAASHDVDSPLEGDDDEENRSVTSSGHDVTDDEEEEGAGSREDDSSDHPEQRERRDSGVGSSLTRAPRSVLVLDTCARVRTVLLLISGQRDAVTRRSLRRHCFCLCGELTVVMMRRRLPGNVYTRCPAQLSAANSCISETRLLGSREFLEALIVLHLFAGYFCESVLFNVIVLC